MPHNRPTSRKRRQSLSFEARLRVYCTLGALILMGLVAAMLALLHVSTGPMLATLGILLLLLLLVLSALIEEAVRPIQTLANVVAALREEDYSFRARGANREDAMGQLSLEINALADTLQAQRVGALEAVALLRRVIAEMDAPVLAFDQDQRLRLLNPAAERVFALQPSRDLGRTAEELSLAALLEQPSEIMLPVEAQANLRRGETQRSAEQAARWMIRRSTFRQRGVPHTLILLSDVSMALREEERLAWRRLIRVIGHEISNSLTPIKSIAGSLRSRLAPAPAQAGGEHAPGNGMLQRDFQRGLSVIENRADSLNRFVQAYRQLAQLPAPVLKRVPLQPLLERVASLEIRLDVRVLPAPGVDLLADPDQIEQLLINLVRNAVEAATFCAGDDPEIAALAEPCDPEVTIRAVEDRDFVSIRVEDNGPGLANPDNLFVPLYTTKKSGSGVGLALARQIVEAHGGTITLRNRAGRLGCMAEVRLPMAQQASEIRAQSSETGSESRTGERR
ncbi:MAG TPA: ATP-binding protein [Acidobacteriaceae bacterium]|nr:ATP-binding protein [Acidobacteriaceae bacterium]